MWNHVFKGNYSRVWHHLLCILGDEVKACICILEKRIEMGKLHTGDTNTAAEINLDNPSLKQSSLGEPSQDRHGSMNEQN